MVSSKTGGGVGTNQYQIRGTSKPSVPAVPAPGDVTLLDQLHHPETVPQICGKVWGTRCKMPVYPPTYAHDEHPSKQVVSPTAPSSVWDALASSDTHWAVWAVAGSPAAPASALEKLADSSDIGIATAVAKHPNTPADTLAGLVDSPYQQVARAAASNPHCGPPWDITSRSALVQAAWSSNPARGGSAIVSADPAVLRAILDDGDHPVSYETQRSVVTWAAQSPSPAVGNVILTHLASRIDIDPGLVDELSRQPHLIVLRRLSANPACTATALHRMIQGDIAIDSQIAQHPHADADTLERLSNSEYPYVRAMVLAHPRVGGKALDNLLRDVDPRIQKEAWNLHGAERPNVAALRGLVSQLGEGLAL